MRQAALCHADDLWLRAGGANELLLTDIDNRAVRRITLADGRASTVPYDNNHLYTELWRLGGPQRHDHGQYVYPRGDRFPSTHATPLSEADRNRDVGVDPAPDNESATAAALAFHSAAWRRGTQHFF